MARPAVAASSARAAVYAEAAAAKSVPVAEAVAPRGLGRVRCVELAVVVLLQHPAAPVEAAAAAVAAATACVAAATAIAAAVLKASAQRPTRGCCQRDQAADEEQEPQGGGPLALPARHLPAARCARCAIDPEGAQLVRPVERERSALLTRLRPLRLPRRLRGPRREEGVACARLAARGVRSAAAHAAIAMHSAPAGCAPAGCVAGGGVRRRGDRRGGDGLDGPSARRRGRSAVAVLQKVGHCLGVELKLTRHRLVARLKQRTRRL
mmetsp:Transcript_41124/g.101501  ORF Transcript_41124/g.101501 Transcript_41124/m.101501 type:complete len:266 (+) Transcript_41124:309-1106(+)